MANFMPCDVLEVAIALEGWVTEGVCGLSAPTFLRMGKRPKGRRRGEASTHWDEDGDGYSSEEY